MAYYGLLRIGELTESPHTLKAKDIEIADNKDKIKLTLYSSKTHTVVNIPQEIKISAEEDTGRKNKFFCPFKLIRSYMKARGNYTNDNDNFFVYSDGSPVQPAAAREMLKTCLRRINKNPDSFNFQSLRIGSTTDLLHFGFTVEQIKRLGRWKSNAIYKYLRPI